MYVAELSPIEFAARFNGSGAAYAAARNEERIIRRQEVAAWKSRKTPARMPAGRTPDRSPSPRMQRINARIAANLAAEEAAQPPITSPTVSAVQPEPVDRAAALDAEITRLKETIAAAEQRLAEAEHERRALKLAAVADQLNAEWAEFNAEFGIEAEPLITDDLVHAALARAEQKAAEVTKTAAEVAAEPMTNAPAEVSVQITSPEPAPTAVENKGKKVVRMTADNPFLAALQDDEDYIVEVVDTVTAAETGAVKAEVEVKTQPLTTYTTDHGTVYAPNPEPDFYTTFASYEPDHVAAVAAGAEARFVAAPDRKWLVAAREEQITPDTGEVIVHRRDGSTTVHTTGDVIARCGTTAVYGIAA